MQLITDCGEISYTPNRLNATMEKYVPGKSNWVLTDTRFPNEGSGIYQRKGIVLRYKDLKQISKTELICMSLRRLWIYSSLQVLLTMKRSALFARSSKKIPLIISKAGGKHCRFSLKTTP
jgi:hypothetical protein